MFWNKEKAIWKEAFKIKKDPKYARIFAINTEIRTCKKWVKYFNTELWRKTRAYALAEQNNFLGSPEFYWNTSNEFIDYKIKAINYAISDLNDQYQNALFFRDIRKELK